VVGGATMVALVRSLGSNRMDERAQVAWLLRRAGFGAAPGQLDEVSVRGAGALLDELVDPDDHGVAPLTDPWGDLDLGQLDPRTARRRKVGLAATSWLAAMATATRPLEEWMRWFWHGHFVSTIREVRMPELMFQQLNMLATHSLGDFRSLLRAVTIDPAMLIYLDGVENTKGNVNENYGRELLELFGLGIGHYNEEDVRAGAVALSGWSIPRGSMSAVFDAGAHDDTLQTYLGRTAVHDVDTVIDAVTDHQACAPWIAGKLTAALLGPEVDRGLVDRLARDFRSSGLQIRPLVRAILEAGLDGASRPLILGPVPWLVSATRYVGAPVDQALLDRTQIVNLVAAGQQPMNAPNVAGWPGGRAWLSSSATVARFNMASQISQLAPADTPALRAAERQDFQVLADELGRPEGYGEATVSALSGIGPEQGGPTSVLAVALASPEGLMA
jgi:uncharacterized protein (DUF1800 family)